MLDFPVVPQRIEMSLDVPLRVVVFPSPDIPGQWVGHCLELDLVSQGDSEIHALEMVRAAVSGLYEYNVRHGLLPLQVRPAPPEVWEAFGIEMPTNIEAHYTLRVLTGSGSELEPGPFVPKFEQKVSPTAPAYAG